MDWASPIAWASPLPYSSIPLEQFTHEKRVPGEDPVKDLPEVDPTQLRDFEKWRTDARRAARFEATHLDNDLIL